MFYCMSNYDDTGGEDDENDDSCHQNSNDTFQSRTRDFKAIASIQCLMSQSVFLTVTDRFIAVQDRVFNGSSFY